MNEQELLNIQVEMGTTYKTMRVLRLDEFIDGFETSLAFTPFLDPTAYMKHGTSAERWLRIAKAFRDCRDTIRKEFEKEP